LRATFPLMLSYAAITPTRNEADNLARLATCMLEQSLPPKQWIIVDNGSTDSTPALARTLAEQHAWIRLIEVPGETVPTRGGPVVRAFHAGLAQLSLPVDVVVKLDADVSFEADHFACLVDAFAQAPSLGIAGGTSLEQQPDARWEPSRLTGDHVRGSVRAYRWDCLTVVTPLEEHMGWDGLDELKAQVRGWRTQTLPHLTYFHHRVMGSREAQRVKWYREGDLAHFMGYRVSYLVVRTVYHVRHEPSAVAMLLGFGAAVIKRKPRFSERDAIVQLRQQQSLGSLPARVREKLGQAA
jgi:glycosyltransferase involved in cell wall biosynthesis